MENKVKNKVNGAPIRIRNFSFSHFALSILWLAQLLSLSIYFLALYQEKAGILSGRLIITVGIAHR